MKKNCIILNIPAAFWKEYPGGRETFDATMLQVDQGNAFCHNTISNKPVNDVEFVYLIIHGKVALRLTLFEFKKASMTFNDGGEQRVFENKNWAILTGPVVPANKDIPMKGFQGFRYTEFLF